MCQGPVGAEEPPSAGLLRPSMEKARRRGLPAVCQGLTGPGTRRLKFPEDFVISPCAIRVQTA